MDILKGNIKSIYFKYLIAAFGGTLIPCIYSVVDVAMVGKYHGPSGPAALAVFAPLWNIIYGLGLAIRLEKSTGNIAGISSVS